MWWFSIHAMHVHGPSRPILSKQTRSPLKWGPGNWRQEIWMDSYRAAARDRRRTVLLEDFQNERPRLELLKLSPPPPPRTCYNAGPLTLSLPPPPPTPKSQSSPSPETLLHRSPFVAKPSSLSFLSFLHNSTLSALNRS